MESLAIATRILLQQFESSLRDAPHDRRVDGDPGLFIDGGEGSGQDRGEDQQADDDQDRPGAGDC